MTVANVGKPTRRGVANTLVTTVPIMLRVLRISREQPDMEPELIAALRFSTTACARATWDACLAVYEHLQLQCAADGDRRKNDDNAATQHAAMEELLRGHHKVLRNALDDVSRILSLAALHQQPLRADAAPPRAAEVATVDVAPAGHALHAALGALSAAPAEPVCVARVRAVARVELQKRSPQGLVLSGQFSAVQAVAWSPDGASVATASQAHTAAVWRAATGEQLSAIDGHALGVRSVAVSPDGRMVATASADKTAVIWSVATGARLHTLASHADWVRCVAWSPDGGTLATASDDKTAALWSAATGERLRTLVGHTGWVRSIAWSPDGRKVATASDDKTAAVWRAATGDRLRTLACHSGSVSLVAWSPDGRTLATASTDGTTRLHFIEP